MKEIWKDIKGYEGLYQVSNLGRVKSFNKNKNGIILKQCYNQYNVLVVTLCNNKISKNFYVHRLVAEYFLEDFDNRLEVYFKDGYKTNCAVNNLYMSNKDNSHNPFKKLHKFDLKDFTIEVKDGFIYIKEL